MNANCFIISIPVKLNPSFEGLIFCKLHLTFILSNIDFTQKSIDFFRFEYYNNIGNKILEVETMNMKNVVNDCKWLADEAEKLMDELQGLLADGLITEDEANRKMRWYLFQTANRILSDSVDKNMPLPNWRTGV